MNHREPPHLPAGMRRALRCLSLLLLPGIGAEGTYLLARTRPSADWAGADPIPYLPATGALPLRFQEPMPAPDLVIRPPAAAPPHPALNFIESSVAMENAAAAQAVSPAPAPPEETPAPEPTDAKPQPPAKTPAPIMLDTARPVIRPEDFLPYFQIPGSAKHPDDVTLLVPTPRSAPAPAPLPPSSATYTQSPK